jgi:hypothetical protein
MIKMLMKTALGRKKKVLMSPFSIISSLAKRKRRTGIGVGLDGLGVQAK